MNTIALIRKILGCILLAIYVVFMIVVFSRTTPNAVASIVGSVITSLWFLCTVGNKFQMILNQKHVWLNIISVLLFLILIMYVRLIATSLSPSPEPFTPIENTVALIALLGSFVVDLFDIFLQP